MNLPQQIIDAIGFEPEHPLASPTVIVTPMYDPDEHWHPLAYFVNGYQRHHEKLSGMAGDWWGNRRHNGTSADTARK